MTLHHTRRVLWAFGLECLIFIAILMALDRVPSWILTVCGIVAMALPIICLLTIVGQPAVYRSCLEFGEEIGRSMITGIRALRACLSIDAIRRGVRRLRKMRTCPATFDDWLALLLFPFKFYVIIALPFMWSCHTIYSMFSVAPSRMGRSEALPVILTGYTLCLLVLLVGALIQALFSKRGRSTQTIVVFLAGALTLLLWPWMVAQPGLMFLPGVMMLWILPGEDSR